MYNKEREVTTMTLRQFAETINEMAITIELFDEHGKGRGEFQLCSFYTPEGLEQYLDFTIDQIVPQESMLSGAWWLNISISTRDLV